MSALSSFGARGGMLPFITAPIPRDRYARSGGVTVAPRRCCRDGGPDRMTHGMVRRAAALACLGATGCLGAIGDPGSETAPPGTDNAAGGPMSMSGPAITAPGQPAAPPAGPGSAAADRCATAAASVEPAPIRLLNSRDYGNPVRGLLGASSAAENAIAGFPPDAVVGFDNDAAALAALPALVEQQSSAAAALAAAANLGVMSPCPLAAGNDACAT